MSGSSEMKRDGDANGGWKVEVARSRGGSGERKRGGDARGGGRGEVARSRNWTPGAPAGLSPMSALPCAAPIVTPQFVQAPPEKPMSPDPPLVSVLAIAVPDSR